MRNSKLKKATALFAALAMIASLGTSTALARGGGGGHGGGGHGGGGHGGGGDGGGGHFGGEGTFVGGEAGFSGVHAGGMHGSIQSHRFYSGGYNACVVNPYNQRQNLTNPVTC
jgi:hypothetical protein